MKTKKFEEKKKNPLFIVIGTALRKCWFLQKDKHLT